jgi:hypothetical protein
MSDTPRTDECIVVYPEENAYDMYVWADFARKLERENAALRKDKERLDSRRIRLMVHIRDNVWKTHEFVDVDLRAAIDAATKEAQP